jgi:hypothetical protein
MKISMDRKYRTKDGREVRLLCVDAKGYWPVVGLIDGELETWTRDGLADGPVTLNLIEYHEPDIRTIWVNVYEGWASGYTDENGAKNMACSGCIAIAQPVTFEVKR